MATFTARVITQSIVFECDTEEQAELLYKAFQEDRYCPLCLQAGLKIDLDACGHLVESDEDCDHWFESGVN